MGHCIQAIVSSSSVADSIQRVYPQLPRANAPQAFAILPVEADFIDAVTAARPPQSTETFMLLTDGFRDLLCELSLFGRLAYVETDYFGGVGGQGAVVYSNRKVLMEPVWGGIGTINRALELIGVEELRAGDRFAALGLDGVRSNDDLLAITAQHNPRRA